MLNNSLFPKNKYSSILKIPEKIFLVLINVFISFFSLAQQNYPIQLNVQLIPPYSGYLPDYATAGNEKLKVILLQKDLTQPTYNVRLAMKLEGNGYTISTKPFFKGQPISLQAGVPVEISGSDIYDFLNSVNLDFTGLNKNTYEQGQALPEGYYSICFTAYDYNSPTPSQVSNQSCAQAWMTLSDPPFLNFPICGSTVQTNTPQNVVFGWTPMNTGSPNSANQTEYIFELWETRPDNNTNPNNIVLSAPPVQTYTTDFSTYNYGMTETQLIAGMQYIWRVRAHDKSNRDLFKNQGYSQICTFVYGSIYDGLNLNLTANSQGTSYRQGKVWWNGLSVFTQYTIQYRKVNGATSTWFTAYSTTPELKINDLEENTAYEAKVQGIANDGYIGPWSNATTFTTPTKPVIACGDQIVPQPGQAIVPLAFATQGMRFKAGLFEVLVTSVQGGAGYFSGTGKVFVPMFGSLLNVTFNNVFVDDNQTVLSGNFYAVTKGVTNWLHDWESIQDSLNTLFTNYNNNPNDTLLVNSLQGMCETINANGDTNNINNFNSIINIPLGNYSINNTNNNNQPLFCSLNKSEQLQYLANHPNTVNGWQTNSNLFNLNSNSIAGSTEQNYFSHGIQPTDYAEYKNWIGPAQDLATNKLNAGIYIITPSVNSNNKVVYYSAYYKWVVSATWFNSQNIPNDNGVAYRNDWTIEPKDIGKFINNADEWGKSSAFLHNFGADYKLRLDVIQYLDGNYLEALKLQWKAALKDPIFWLSLAHTSVSLFDASASKFAKTNFIKEVNVNNKIRTIWHTAYKINNSRIRLLLGTNKNKIAIIGRQMEGHVKVLRTELQAEGINAEIFDKNIIPNETFLIDGEFKTWAQLENDLANGNYSRNPINNHVLDVDLPKTLIYKANKVWADKLVNQGYHVYDAGYINNTYNKSVFYEMELKTIFKDGQ